MKTRVKIARRTGMRRVRARTPKVDLCRIAAEVEEQRNADRARYERPPEPNAQDIREAIQDGEMGDARLFAALFRGRRVYDIAAAKWYAFSAHYWKEYESILADFDELVDLYHRELTAVDSRVGEAAARGEDRKAEEKYSDSLRQRLKELNRLHRQRNVLELARGSVAGEGGAWDRLGISGNEWDQQPYIIACENGVIELTREAPYYRKRDGRPEDYVKAVVPTSWQGINAPALRWQQFLEQIFEDHREIIPYLARVVGYALAGRPVERVYYILWGSGANGKTTLINALQAVLGQSVVGQIECELFLRNNGIRSSSTARPDLLALRGMRLAVASETGEGRHIDAAELKRLTGRDKLTGRTLYSAKIVTWEPTHTVWQLTNHRPGIDAMDQAMWDRTRLIPFTRRFVRPGECEFDPTARPIDVHLHEHLLREAPGILAWCVRGWTDYAERVDAGRGDGLAPPPVVGQSTHDFREEQDVEGRFIQECCEDAPGERVMVREVSGRYTDWCSDQGLTGNWGKVSKRIRETHESRRTGRGTYYIGLRLRQIVEQETHSSDNDGLMG